MNSREVLVSGAFDDIRSRDLRFLEEASRLGSVNVLLWSDELVARHLGSKPKFPLAERDYFLKAVRFVGRVTLWNDLDNPNHLPDGISGENSIWADRENDATPVRKEHSRNRGIEYRVFTNETLGNFPDPDPLAVSPGRKKVVVTGCYDWLHSGHVRFFEEAGTFGDLYVIVGHDANIRLLKGEGHPMLPARERRYVVGTIRFVKQGLISSGDGWLDADPEIHLLKPDIYVVNEDGDKGGKREYCERLGIEYRVLKRAPAPGLPQRTSTELRGF